MGVCLIKHLRAFVPPAKLLALTVLKTILPRTKINNKDMVLPFAALLNCVDKNLQQDGIFFLHALLPTLADVERRVLLRYLVALLNGTFATEGPYESGATGQVQTVLVYVDMGALLYTSFCVRER